MHFRYLIILVLLVGCVSPPEVAEEPVPAVRPGWNIHTFPPGAWVSYQIKRYIKDSPDDAPRNLSLATMKISIIERTTFQDKEHFWVEYLINEGKEQERVIKFIVDNEGTPQPHRVIRKYGNLPAVELELRRWETRTRLLVGTIFYEMTKSFNIIPFVKPPHQGTVTDEEIQLNINGQETKVHCQKTVLDEEEYGLEGMIWYATTVPLAGLVKAFFIEGEYRTSITLEGFGRTGAKSVITEQPVKLDFRDE